ncbi:MAG TPA: pyridoxamine 5'-phosphate oxidase [Luteitalea sp.]|nr:pyridoxamine 5'-phosphate oxidase [Luteitalea sp.]
MLDPIARFQDVMARAAANPPFDPIALSLATSTPDGLPSCRVVLLHEVDERGFVFHTNYGGRKAKDLEANPHAALCAYWPWIDEQVRVEGTVARVSASESDRYFAVRPRGSQIGAWASLQSQPLESREVLLARVKEFEAKFEGGDVPRPDNWGGYRLTPLRIEFWKAGEFRLHDREVFERVGEAWSAAQRLFP